MNNMSSLIYIFLTKEKKMILIMIFAILNKSKMIIIVIFYISLINDLEKWYKTTKINCFHWISRIMQWVMIVVMMSNTRTSRKFQIYMRDLFMKDKLSSIYFNKAHMIWMKRYFRQKFELFKWLYLFVSWIFLMMMFSSSMKCRFEEKLILTNSMPIYIQAITNRMNVRYSIIKMTKKKTEKKVMKMTNEIMKNLKNEQKILIFYSFINKMKRIEESLQCYVYYSKSDLKKSFLEDWEDERKKIMINMNALSADMNIAEVMIMIYLRKTFECISFLQESERRERENEMFKSITIIDEMNYWWL